MGVAAPMTGVVPRRPPRVGEAVIGKQWNNFAEFASSAHAADSLGLQKSSISLCCIGREDGMMIMMPVLMWCTSYMPVCMFAWKCNYISIRLKILATGY